MDTYKRNNARQKQLKIDWNTILFFIPYWLLAIFAVFLLLMLASLIYMFTPLTQNSLPAISRIVFIFAEIAVAFFVGRVSGGPGLISGILFGLGFTLIVLLVGLFTACISIFSLEFILMLITGILIGAFGGIAGKNSTTRGIRRKRYIVK